MSQEFQKIYLNHNSLGGSLGGNDLEFHRCNHFRVEANLRFVGTQFANFWDGNLLAIHHLPRPSPDHLRHIFFGDAPEQIAVFPGGHGNGQLPDHFQGVFAGEGFLFFPNSLLAFLAPVVARLDARYRVSPSPLSDLIPLPLSKNY